MKILDGRKARERERESLRVAVSAIAQRRGRAPSLAIVQVGDVKESSIYIAQKLSFAKSIGAEALHVRLPADISFQALEAEMRAYNADPSTDGIIIQLPLPPHIDRDAALNLIDPKKDVDGLTDENQRLLTEGKPRFVPATARGIMTLLRFYGIDVRGKKACVIGRSKLVGSPTARALALAGADVSVCHSKTPDAPAVASAADILVAAIGKPWHIGAAYIKPGAVVIDVGLTSDPGAQGLRGDVDPAALQGRAFAATPVPGGVGPMTVLSLFANLIASAEARSR